MSCLGALRAFSHLELAGRVGAIVSEVRILEAPGLVLLSLALDPESCPRTLLEAFAGQPASPTPKTRSTHLYWRQPPHPPTARPKVTWHPLLPHKRRDFPAPGPLALVFAGGSAGADGRVGLCVEPGLCDEPLSVRQLRPHGGFAPRRRLRAEGAQGSSRLGRCEHHSPKDAACVLKRMGFIVSGIFLGLG